MRHKYTRYAATGIHRSRPKIFVQSSVYVAPYLRQKINFSRQDIALKRKEITAFVVVNRRAKDNVFIGFPFVTRHGVIFGLIIFSPMLKPESPWTGKPDFMVFLNETRFCS